MKIKRVLYRACTIMLMLASTGMSQSGWVWQNPLPQGNHLSSVSFVDANIGTAVGDAGTILRTTDGGATWTPQQSNTTSWLFGVSFGDANHGVAVGNFSTMLRTTDGGFTWIESLSPTNLLAVCFVDANIGQE